LAALRQDYTRILNQDALRAALAPLLREAGILVSDPPQPRKRATLRIIENDDEPPEE
jgi:hypothetical protein